MAADFQAKGLAFNDTRAGNEEETRGFGQAVPEGLVRGHRCWGRRPSPVWVALVKRVAGTVTERPDTGGKLIQVLTR